MRRPESNPIIMKKQTAAQHPDAAEVQARVLLGIAGNRTPGLHFPGYFLGISRPRIDGDTVDMSVPCTPFTRDADGAIDLTALCFLADSALATSTRSQVAPGARLATLHLQMQFTGRHATADMHARAHSTGACVDTAVRQLMATATIEGTDGVVCHASGEFAALDPPPGVALAPLPWQLEVPPQPPALRPRDLAADEKPVFRACNSALAKAIDQPSFIQQFWGGLPLRGEGSARTRFVIGPHLTNRVGHVQGGISVGVAARCACAAAPAGMMLSNITAWYISPGRGKALIARSRTVHAGKTIAVVRTEVKNDAGARVLEVVTHHVARSRN
ncbi:MAG: PaaI family thioesterase [Betaproteobacteria bacterium]|nr:PaaI family thioesterase [Betaproteobacteria bacterium]